MQIFIQNLKKKTIKKWSCCFFQLLWHCQFLFQNDSQKLTNSCDFLVFNAFYKRSEKWKLKLIYRKVFLPTPKNYNHSFIFVFLFLYATFKHTSSNFQSVDLKGSALKTNGSKKSKKIWKSSLPQKLEVLQKLKKQQLHFSICFPKFVFEIWSSCFFNFCGTPNFCCRNDLWCWSDFFAPLVSNALQLRSKK